MKAAHADIEKVEISDAETFVSGSVHGSLITPGGKAPRGRALGDGASTIGGGTWDGGSAMGGTVAAAGRLAEVDELLPDEKADEETSSAMPRFPMPATLPGPMVDTLEKLFKGECNKLDQQGKTVYELFHALGGGFEASYNTDTQNLKVTYRPLAEQLAKEGKDTRGATAFKDHTHSPAGGYEGLQFGFARRCLDLLQAAGIEQQDVTQLALRTKCAKVGGGVAAAAAEDRVRSGAGGPEDELVSRLKDSGQGKGGGKPGKSGKPG